ncbi:MAG: hypothetical protein R3D62_00705 [Xanthobacteraceae bacterium]
MAPTVPEKTTVLRLVMGLIAPSGGRITWADRGSTTGRRLALVSQRP